MKKTVVAFLIVAGFSALATPTPAAAKGKGGDAVLIPPDDLKWNDVPGFEGVKIAVVEGDSTKGPHHSFVKFPPGFSAPLHHHTANHYVAVISGTVVLVVDGQDHKLPAGSYFAFTGKKKHETRCEAGADCVLFLDARSKWDVVPEAKAASKK
jgi:quercetin dioxygenase-like cupin family protein